MIGKTWRESWEHVIPVLAFPDDVGRVVYTTNTIEALHPQIRKTIKTRGHFLNEDAARKLIYLAITNAQKSWRSTYNGAPHCFHSKSTSETDCPDPLTQEVGHPPTFWLTRASRAPSVTAVTDDRHRARVAGANDSADCRSYGSLTNLQSEKGASPCNLASQRRLLHGRPRSSHCSSA
jgi:hypothetical protein